MVLFPDQITETVTGTLTEPAPEQPPVQDSTPIDAVFSSTGSFADISVFNVDNAELVVPIFGPPEPKGLVSAL